ncbi:MAG: N-acetylneuraminate synthase family protein [Alphaproteobacteria bacterium]|nr:N-acetylneuraminate synthase family protein [Alphaproteobacteria bacterium]
MKTLIIAEAGVNHEKNMAQAEQLVDIAAKAGVDVFKTQTFTAGSLVTRNCPPAQYQTDNVGAAEQYSMLEQLELPYAWHTPLKARAEAAGMEFLSTAFEFESFDFLMGLGLRRIKIPSGEISNLPFVVHQARAKLPLILSTGMATMDEIYDALGACIVGYRGDTHVNINTIRAAWADKDARKLLDGRVTVLHCTTNYPVKWDEVDMRALPTMHKLLGLPIGYSDHTPGIVASLAAVAMGATIIEKHYTISRAMDGAAGHPSPDHKASLEPNELQALVEGIRMVEQSPTLDTVREACKALEARYAIQSGIEHLDTLLGRAEKVPAQGAREVARVAKKSIVASKAIKVGEVFGYNNITMKRPMGGMAPDAFFDLLGKPSAQSYAPDDFIAPSELAAPKVA